MALPTIQLGQALRLRTYVIVHIVLGAFGTAIVAQVVPVVGLYHGLGQVGARVANRYVYPPGKLARRELAA